MNEFIKYLLAIHFFNYFILIKLLDNNNFLLMFRVFYHIGYFGSKYPCFVFLICLALSGIMSLGLYNLQVLTDPQCIAVIIK